MKTAIFHFMMIFRKPILFITKILMILMVFAGLFAVAGLIRGTENAANIIGMAVFSFGAVFLLYFFRYYYDKIILRLNPDDTELILFK